jgi:hypothetical protein
VDVKVFGVEGALPFNQTALDALGRLLARERNGKIFSLAMPLATIGSAIIVVVIACAAKYGYCSFLGVPGVLETRSDGFAPLNSVVATGAGDTTEAPAASPTAVAAVTGATATGSRREGEGRRVVPFEIGNDRA